MYCTNCGKEIIDEAEFCPYCGNKIVNRTSINAGPMTEENAKPRKKITIPLIIGALLVLAVVYIANKPLSAQPASEKLLKDIELGGQVYFGHYEQDNNMDNGEEEILWDVIGETDEYYYLLSHYILDAQPYDTMETGSSFGYSYIRTWLNNSFYSQAFSSDETAYIINSKNDTDPEGSYVFLLSMEDICNFFRCTTHVSGAGETCYRSSEIICGATDYAIAQGLRVDDSVTDVPEEYKNRVTAWLLDYNPNINYNLTTTVSTTGLAGSIQYRFTDQCGVRPVILVKKVVE